MKRVRAAVFYQLLAAHAWRVSRGKFTWCALFEIVCLICWASDPIYSPVWNAAERLAHPTRIFLLLQGGVRAHGALAKCMRGECAGTAPSAPSSAQHIPSGAAFAHPAHVRDELEALLNFYLTYCWSAFELATLFARGERGLLSREGWGRLGTGG